MNLLNKIKNWFFRTDYRSERLPDSVELCKRIETYQENLIADDSGYLLLNSLNHPCWSQDNFISLNGNFIKEAKVLLCRPRCGGKEFYIFAYPFTSSWQSDGYVGFIIGSKKAVFVPEENYIILPTPEYFEVELEGTKCMLHCRLVQTGDKLKRVLGIYPEVFTVGISLNGIFLSLDDDTSWNSMKQAVKYLQNQ